MAAVSDLVTYREYDRFCQETNRGHPLDVVRGVICHFPTALMGLKARTHEPDERDRRLDHPVQFVSREEAEEYCSWRSEKFGRRYRLPTEAEWADAMAARPAPEPWKPGTMLEFVADGLRGRRVCAADFHQAQKKKRADLGLEGEYGTYYSTSSSGEGVGFRVLVLVED